MLSSSRSQTRPILSSPNTETYYVCIPNSASAFGSVTNITITTTIVLRIVLRSSSSTMRSTEYHHTCYLLPILGASADTAAACCSTQRVAVHWCRNRKSPRSGIFFSFLTNHRRWAVVSGLRVVCMQHLLHNNSSSRSSRSGGRSSAFAFFFFLLFATRTRISLPPSPTFFSSIRKHTSHPHTKVPA